MREITKGGREARMDASEGIENLNSRGRQGQYIFVFKSVHMIWWSHTFQRNLRKRILFRHGCICLRILVVVIKLIALRVVAHGVVVEDVAGISGMFDFLRRPFNHSK